MTSLVGNQGDPSKQFYVVKTLCFGCDNVVNERRDNVKMYTPKNVVTTLYCKQLTTNNGNIQPKYNLNPVTYLEVIVWSNHNIAEKYIIFTMLLQHYLTTLWARCYTTL